jgi:hypothetical protein
LPNASSLESDRCLQPPVFQDVLPGSTTATSTTLGGTSVPVLTRWLWRPIHVVHSCGRHKSTLPAYCHSLDHTNDAIQPVAVCAHKPHIAQSIAVLSSVSPLMVARRRTSWFVPVTVTVFALDLNAFVPRSVVSPRVFVLSRVSTNTVPVSEYSRLSHTPRLTTEPIVIPPIHGHTRSILRDRP